MFLAVGTHGGLTLYRRNARFCDEEATSYSTTNRRVLEEGRSFLKSLSLRDVRHLFLLFSGNRLPFYAADDPTNLRL